MSHSLLRRAKARRGLQAEKVEQTHERDAFSDDSGVRGIITHGLAALAISALGVGVMGSVGLTATAQSQDTSTRASLSADAPDVTRAEPATRARDLDRENQAAVQADDQRSTGDDSSNGSLDGFNRRQDQTSRNAVRSGLDGALAVEQAKSRTTRLNESGQNVTQTSRRALQGARATNLKQSQRQISAENKRLTEEKKKKEEQKAKEGEKGKLRAPARAAAAAAPAPAGHSDSTQISGSGGAAPIAKGKYHIAARWGDVGSWARYHTGLDLAAPIGTPIHAAADGVVVGPGSGTGWAGIHVVLEHAGGEHTLYAHMARTTVHEGQKVKAGDLIGYVGMTGRSFGPHCHFEYYPKGAAPGDVYSNKDPYAWMLSKGVKL